MTAAVGARAPTIAVVEHQPSCPVGWVGDWLAAAGARLTIFRPYAGPPGHPAALPADLTAYAGLVVLGGTMSSADDTAYPWLPGVRELIRGAADRGVPTLGICLGHQLAAAALGGRVAPNPRGRSIGLVEVHWGADAAADPLVGTMAAASADRLARPRGVHWNDDIVTELPAGAVVLARAATGEVQAVRFAPTVWGVQWHPEVGPGIASDWMREDEGAPELAGVDVGAHVAAIATAEPELRRDWGALADRFAAICRVSRTVA